MTSIDAVISGIEHHKSRACVDENGNRCPYFQYINNCTGELLNDALELLREQPHWISVEERLPRSVGNKVIVYLQHEDYVPQIGYGHYEKYKGVEMWYNLETGEQFAKRGYNVTHWMKMPKSPYGEKLILD